MKLVKPVFSILTIALMFTACKNIDFKKTSAGVPYKVFGDYKKDSILPNNIVKFEVVQKVKDSLLYSSYKEGRAQYLQVPVTPGPKATYNDIRANIVEILPLLHKGDSVYITQSTDSLIK